MKTYWNRIETHSPLRMEQVYATVIRQPSLDPDHASRIGILLADTGKPEAALHVRAPWWSTPETGRSLGLLAALGGLALILQARGDLDGAMVLSKEQDASVANSATRMGCKPHLVIRR